MGDRYQGSGAADEEAAAARIYCIGGVHMARQRYLSRVRRNSRPEAEKSAETDIAEPKIRLRQIRKARGITQEQLAKMIHVSKGNISAWECGRCEMNYTNLISVSRIFNCSIDYLLGVESEGEADEA